jgi:pyruvate ferredoxin oxidoreductase alpha subunit
MREFLEGSNAIAKVVKLCRPGVISAYPITPQTHIVEGLAQIVADGELDSEFINVESEQSAASVVLGASATGVRAYTATSSQGLLLMAEVLFNIAGMRLPLVLTCANRAVSAPINIWNDHQDSVAVRDSGWIQLYAESVQEACDLHIQAYKITEDHKIQLPVMVCIDGFILTHAGEVVDIPAQEEVEGFLPAFKPLHKLDIKNPITLGVLGDPDYYMETRYAIQETMKDSLKVIQDVANDFKKAFGRGGVGLIETYMSEDAEKVLVVKGSVAGTVKEVVDEMRAEGKKVGLVRVISHRPFPENEILKALGKVKYAGIVEKSISLGAYGPLYTDIKAVFQGKEAGPVINGFVIGLGGRDIKKDSIRTIFDKLSDKGPADEFIDLKL